MKPKSIVYEAQQQTDKNRKNWSIKLQYCLGYQTKLQLTELVYQYKSTNHIRQH